ncbi:MAG: outer membrane protein assembly factor BamD [Flavobacteriia bacterium]|nr:outer membrane protein assembly factor BamD [Flavobacteriia bacterium]
MKKGIYFFFALILLSCSQYNKVLKSDNFDEKYDLAEQYFKKKKWNKSLALYEHVYQRVPKSEKGQLSYFKIGKLYYEMGDFYMSGYHFGTFFDKYPYSHLTEEAFFYKALCSVKNSPDYYLDQKDTELALNYMQEFINLFPKSNRIDTCNVIMDELRLKLEKKNFESIKLYNKTNQYRSVVTTSKTFLNEFPLSKNKESVYEMLLDNSYYLTINSINEKKKERIDEFLKIFRNFASLYPTNSVLRAYENKKLAIEKELLDINNTTKK